MFSTVSSCALMLSSAATPSPRLGSRLAGGGMSASTAFLFFPASPSSPPPPLAMADRSVIVLDLQHIPTYGTGRWLVFKRRRHATLIGKVSCYLSIDGATIDHDTHQGIRSLPYIP